MITILERNPHYKNLNLNKMALNNLFQESINNYVNLPSYHKGESKEIKQTKQAKILIQRFLPSVYSYTANRAAIIPGSDEIRMAVSKILWKPLHKAGIPTCVLAMTNRYALITEEKIPPIEVIVKAALVGTPAHIYHGIFNKSDRFGNPFIKGEIHNPYVRFDYRNPVCDKKGNRLKDELLPIALARRFINTDVAENTALKIYFLVQKTLNKVNLQVLDFCLFLDETGGILCGELSPDNMRIKDLSCKTDYDKDLWRKGKTKEELLEKWNKIRTILENAYETI